MFAESPEGDDGVSVSSGIDNEEEPTPSATSKGGSLTTTMRRKGLPTPPATPGTTRGGYTSVSWHDYLVTATASTASILCSVRLDTDVALLHSATTFCVTRPKADGHI